MLDLLHERKGEGLPQHPEFAGRELRNTTWKVSGPSPWNKVKRLAE
jgi:hypothetical protein